MSIFIYIVISLAIIGLTVQLITNFTGFLMSILLMLIIAFVVFLIFNHFAGNRASSASGYRSSPEMRKYRQAVKRSQEKYGRQNVTIKPRQQERKSKSERKRRWRRRPTHLRVIDGKKSNNNDDKNNRATY